MNNSFENELRRSMDSLVFTPGEKDLICGRLAFAAARGEDHATTRMEGVKMKKRLIPRTVLIAATMIMVMTATVFAAGKITSWVSHTYVGNEYLSAEEMNDAAAQLAYPALPDALAGGYAFESGNTVDVSGVDDAGEVADTWKDLSAQYTNKDGITVSLSVTDHFDAKEENNATLTRTIADIPVYYYYDEYLTLASENDLTGEMKERLESDDHFFVGYGSGGTETLFYSSVTFVKDGYFYHLYTKDGISADDLFAMAEEILMK